MATFEFNLSEPPSDSRQRELWLQHAIGFVLFQDVRNYALQQVDPLLNENEPRIHSTHALLFGAPTVVEYVPAVQLAHLCDGYTMYCPALQVWHAADDDAPS